MRGNSGFTATLFGGYGFIGSYIAQELGDTGTRVYVPFRGCELEPRHLKPMFDHGGLGLIPYSARDEELLKKSMQYSDVVINCIGKHYETKHIVPTRRSNGKLSRINFSFEEVNITIPRNIARIAKQSGVQVFIHLSALSADVDSNSEWSRTKALGEIAVREEFPDAIIVRPANVFGPEDRFLTNIAEIISKFGFFPLINGGNNLVQPVYCTDVSRAVLDIIYNYQEYQGRTFQLAGPDEYSYKEVVEFVSDVTTLKASIVDIPIPIAKLFSKIENELIKPVITPDQINQILEDNILLVNPDYLTFKDLGIKPLSMDLKAFDFLIRFRPGGHFRYVEGYHK
eukprot:gene17412-22961_t